MSYQIPLQASQAISEAAKLAATVDSVTNSLKSAVTQSGILSHNLSTVAKRQEDLKRLSTGFGALGNSVRRLNADVIGYNQAMLQLETITRRATTANAQFAQQVTGQQGRIVSALNNEAKAVDLVREKRLASDKAIVASAKESSASIVAALKAQSTEARATSKSWAVAQKEQVEAIKILQKSMEQLNKTIASLDASTRKSVQESTRAAAVERTRSEAMNKAKSEQRSLTEETARATSSTRNVTQTLQQNVAQYQSQARSLNDLSSTLIRTTKVSDDFWRNTASGALTAGKSRTEIKNLELSHRRLTEEVGRGSVAGTNAIRVHLDAAKAHATHRSNLSAQTAQTERATAALHRMTAALTANNLVTGTARERLFRLGGTTRTHTAATVQASVATMTLAARVGKLSEGLQNLTASKRLTNQATSAMRAGMIASGTSFGIFTSETIVAAVAVYGLVSALKAVITIGAEFEDSMTRAFAIMGVTGDFSATEQLTGFVREIGATTRFTANEAAQGLVLLGMAGLNVKESMDALQPALNIASIGMVDMSFAADLVTNVMNEFGMESEDIIHIADVLAVAVTDANVSIEQLGLSLSYIGPIAANTNNSLEDTVGMIQLMGDNAIKASRAGTALRRAMSNLLDPNDKAVSTMVRLGASIRNVDGEIIPLIDYMKKMAAAGAEVTDVISLFGVRAAPAMMAVLNDLSKGFDENGEAIAGYVSNVEQYAGNLIGIAGESDKLRKEMENTLVADTKILVSAMTDVSLSAFEELHADLRALIQSATSFAQSLDPESIRNFTRATLDLVSTIGTLVKWGAGLYGLYKVVSVGSKVWATATVAMQAATFVTGASVGPLTAQATALTTQAAGLQASAASLSVYAPASIRAALASRTLTASLITLSAAAWPLMVFGAIAAVVYKYSTASSNAAYSSAKLRAEMNAEQIQADRLKNSVVELTDKERERIELREKGRVDANSQLIEEYEQQIEKTNLKIERLNSNVESLSLLQMDSVSGHIEGQQAKIDQLKLEIFDLEDLIKGAEADSEKVRLAAEERKANTTRPSGINASASTENRIRQTMAEANAIMMGLQYAVTDSISDLEKSREGADEFNLPKMLEAENKLSDGRIGIFEKEQKRKQDLHSLHLASYALMNENSEREVHRQTINFAKQTHEETIQFMDQELSHALANKKVLGGNFSDLVNANEGGDVLDQSQQAFLEAATRVRELMDARQEYVDSYTAQNIELKNKGMTLWTAEENNIRSLVSAYDPLAGALIDRVGKEKEILTLLEQKHISEAAAAEAMRMVKFQYDQVRSPLDQYRVSIENEIELLQAQAEVTRTGNYEQLVSVQLKQAGTEATKEQIAAIAESMRIREEWKLQSRGMKSEAEAFQEAWEEAVSRVDEAFENAWAGAFDSFTEFRDLLVDSFKQMLATIAHHAITKPILVNFGVMPTGAPGASQTGSGASQTGSGASQTGSGSGMGGTGTMASVASAGAGGNVAGYLSNLSNGITGTVGNVSMFASDMAGTLGFKSLSQSAYRQGAELSAGGMGAAANLAGSALGGVAGGYTGGKIGEAVFGKQAESNIASSVLGTVGTIMGGPVGAFLGSLIGSMADVAFGGDGRERASAGFSTGGMSEVRGKYEYDTRTFDSGLEISSIARRVDQQVSDQIVEQFSAFDSAFTQISNASNIKVDFSKVNLSGANADAGAAGEGSFFGATGFNGLGDSEQQLEEAGRNFVQQLIAQVSGDFSVDVREAIESATGDAQQILTQYEAVLSLNNLFTAGSKLFTNVDTFGATMDVLTEQFMTNGESLGEMVNKIKSVNDTLGLMDIGDGTSDYTQTALGIAEAAGGVENLEAMVRVFTDMVIGREQEIENVTKRLQVSTEKQFNEIGLTLDNFDVSSFRSHFDSLKDSVDAIDLVKLIQAGNSLALLTDLEAELASVRAESFSKLEEELGAAQALMDRVTRVGDSIQASIDSELGTTTAPSGPASDSIADQISYIERMQAYYERNYKTELKLEEDLHKVKVDNFKQQQKLFEQINDYLNKLSLSDLSPMTSKERRDFAYSEFQSLATLAEGGDLEAASKLTAAAQEFLAIERERETTNSKYVASYEEVVGRLSGLKGQYGLASDPGEFSSQALSSSAEYISNMQGLQQQLNGIANAISISVLEKLDSIDSRIAKLPEALQFALRELMSSDASEVLSYGTSGGIIRQDVVGALKLLPDAEELSSLSIAQHIENLTNLSQFPNLLSDTFSNSVGTMLEYLVAQGHSITALADAVMQNTLIKGAANEYIGKNYGGSTVEDYSTNSAIGSYLDNVSSQDMSFDDKARQIFTDANANNIGAEQLAAVWNARNPDEQYSAADIHAVANQLGLPMFANGALTSGPTLAMIGERTPELVSPIKDYATFERDNLVSTIISATRSGGGTSNREVVDAINKNTEAVKSSSESSVLHLKVVTVDGKVIVDETIDTIKRRSKNGEIVVDAKGVSGR